MKKILIGCGVIILLGVIGFCVLIYVGYQYGKGMVKDMAEMQEKYVSVDAKYSFKAPDDGMMTAEQMDKWIAVRKDITGPCEQFSMFFGKKPEGNPFSLIKKMFSLINQVAGEHAKSLDQHQMSREEYAWITSEVLGVLDSGDAQKDEKLKQLIGQIDKLETPDQSGRNGMPITAHAAALTTDQIKKMLPMVEARADQIEQTKNVFAFDGFILAQSGQMSRQQMRRQRALAVQTESEEENEETTGTVTPAMSPAPAQ